MTAPPGTLARHTAHVMGTVFSFRLVAPASMSRRDISAALADAVNELRAVDVAFSPYREGSLVCRVRREELSQPSYPAVLAEIVDACARMRALTDGWFDAWAVPGGFDPSGVVKGWAIERAGARLDRAGITSYAINGGGDITVRGHAPHGGPWRIGIRDPDRADTVVMTLDLTDVAIATSGGYERGGHIVDPHTGSPVTRAGSATVIGPDLALADGYATALFAAGSPGLAWFPPHTGYDALIIDEGLAATFTAGLDNYRQKARAA